MKVKILLADDHQIVRDGLSTLLKNQPEFEIVGEADNGREALKMVESLDPDIVIMDVAMPDLNGIEATRQIVNSYQGVKVIALSMHSDKRFVSKMLKAGASAYLLKDCAFEELVTALRAVLKNNVYLSPEIAGLVVDDFVSPLCKEESSAYTLLSNREREVLQLLAEGKGTKEIARHLSVSVKTVETHRTNIMSKLDIHSVAELTKFAIREGLTTL